MKEQTKNYIELKKKFLKMYCTGARITDIADTLELPRGTVYFWLKNMPKIQLEVKLSQIDLIRADLIKEADNITNALLEKNGNFKVRRLIRSTIIQTLVNNL